MRRSRRRPRCRPSPGQRRRSRCVEPRPRPRQDAGRRRCRARRRWPAGRRTTRGQLSDSLVGERGGARATCRERLPSRPRPRRPSASSTTISPRTVSSFEHERLLGPPRPPRHRVATAPRSSSVRGRLRHPDACGARSTYRSSEVGRSVDNGPRAGDGWSPVGSVISGRRLDRPTTSQIAAAARCDATAGRSAGEHARMEARLPRSVRRRRPGTRRVHGLQQTAAHEVPDRCVARGRHCGGADGPRVLVAPAGSGDGRCRASRQSSNAGVTGSVGRLVDPSAPTVELCLSPLAGRG